MTTIRFERDGAIGNIVLANPPFNRMQPGHFGWSPVCLAILVKLRKASILIETVVAL